MKALNQTMLSDEARAGFVLVGIFCCADVFDSVMPLYTFLGRSFGWVGSDAGRGQLVAVIGGLQFSLLLTIFFILTIARRHVLAHLECAPIAQSALSQAAGQIAMQVAGRRVALVMTSNMLDSNAFCMRSGMGPCIVVGGGLRLQFAKAGLRAQALAKLAHEFAHIRNKDVGLMLVVTRLVISYLFLNCLSLLYVQVEFWTSVQWAGFVRWGYGLLDVFLIQLPAALSNLLPLVSLATVVFTHVLLVQNREYYADEVAAVYGHRAGIRSELARSLALQTWMSSIFHPGFSARLAHITAPDSWTRIQVLFVIGIMFVTARATDAIVGALEPLSPVEQVADETLADAVIALKDNTPYLARLVVYLTAYTLGIYIVAHHIYRVSLSCLANGRRLSGLLMNAAFAGILCVIGDWLGTISAPRFLAVMAEDTPEGNLYLETELAGSLAAGSMAALFALAAAALAALLVRRSPHSRFRMLGWSIGLLVAFHLLSIPFNFALYLVARQFEIEAMYDFDQPLSTGLPAWWMPVQALTILGSILVLGLLCNGLARVLGGPLRSTAAHARRLIEFIA